MHKNKMSRSSKDSEPKGTVSEKIVNAQNRALQGESNTCTHQSKSKTQQFALPTQS